MATHVAFSGADWPRLADKRGTYFCLSLWASLHSSGARTTLNVKGRTLTVKSTSTLVTVHPWGMHDAQGTDVISSVRLSKQALDRAGPCQLIH